MTQQTTAGFVPQQSFFSALPSLYLNNGQISRASNTTLTIQPGQFRDSTNSSDIVLGTYFDDPSVTPAPVTLNAAVNGVNGLDSGTLAASTMYYVYAISDPTSYQTTATILSLSSSTPALPFGYGAYRRIGSWATDGSTHFVVGNYSASTAGREFFYDAPVQVLSAGSATTATAVTLLNIVPNFNNIAVNLESLYTPSSAAHTAVIVPGTSTSTTTVILQNAAAAAQQLPPFRVLAQTVSAAPKVLYNVTSGDTLSLWVAGYVDPV